MFKKISKISLSTLMILMASSAAVSEEKETAEVKIARAMTAAPSDISARATIMDVDGTILRKGNNGWVCLPGVGLIPGDKHPMCNDKVWMSWMKSAANGGKFSTDVIGVSYMMAGDAMVNNDDPAATDKTKGMWVQEGPHLMMLFPNKEMYANLPRNPYSGGPYVMWDRTPLAHVMVPLKAKDQKKTALNKH